MSELSQEQKSTLTATLKKLRDQGKDAAYLQDFTAKYKAKYLGAEKKNKEPKEEVTQNGESQQAEPLLDGKGQITDGSSESLIPDKPDYSNLDIDRFEELDTQIKEQDEYSKAVSEHINNSGSYKGLPMPEKPEWTTVEGVSIDDTREEHKKLLFQKAEADDKFYSEKGGYADDNKKIEALNKENQETEKKQTFVDYLKRGIGNIANVRAMIPHSNEAMIDQESIETNAEKIKEITDGVVAEKTEELTAMSYTWNSKKTAFQKEYNKLEQDLQDGGIDLATFQSREAEMNTELEEGAKNIQEAYTGFENLEKFANNAYMLSEIRDQSWVETGLKGFSNEIVKSPRVVGSLIKASASLIDARGPINTGSALKATEGVYQWLSAVTESGTVKLDQDNSISAFTGQVFGQGAMMIGSSALTGVAFPAALYSFGMVHDEMYTELREEGLTDQQAVWMANGYAAIAAPLEYYGARTGINAFAKNALKQKFKKELLKDGIGALTKGKVDDFLYKGAWKEFKGAMSQEMIEEAVTEGLQFMEQDGIKELYNANYLGEKQKELHTLKGWDYAKELGTNVIGGAAGGLMLGSFGAWQNASQTGSNNYEKAFELLGNNKFMESFKTSLKNGLDNNAMTQYQYDETLKGVNRGIEAQSEISEDFSTKDKAKAMGLILEKKELEDIISGKDAAISKPIKEQIKILDEQLADIGYQYNPEMKAIKDAEEKEKAERMGEKKKTLVADRKKKIDAEIQDKKKKAEEKRAKEFKDREAKRQEKNKTEVEKVTDKITTEKEVVAKREADIKVLVEKENPSAIDLEKVKKLEEQNKLSEEKLRLLDQQVKEFEAEANKEDAEIKKQADRIFAKEEADLENEIQELKGSLSTEAKAKDDKAQELEAKLEKAIKEGVSNVELAKLAAEIEAHDKSNTMTNEYMEKRKTLLNAVAEKTKKYKAITERVKKGEVLQDVYKKDKEFEPEFRSEEEEMQWADEKSSEIETTFADIEVDYEGPVKGLTDEKRAERRNKIKEARKSVPRKVLDSLYRWFKSETTRNESENPWENDLLNSTIRESDLNEELGYGKKDHNVSNEWFSDDALAIDKIQEELNGQYGNGDKENPSITIEMIKEYILSNPKKKTGQLTENQIKARRAYKLATGKSILNHDKIEPDDQTVLTVDELNDILEKQWNNEEELNRAIEEAAAAKQAKAKREKTKAANLGGKSKSSKPNIKASTARIKVVNNEFDINEIKDSHPKAYAALRAALRWGDNVTWEQISNLYTKINLHMPSTKKVLDENVELMKELEEIIPLFKPLRTSTKAEAIKKIKRSRKTPEQKEMMIEMINAIKTDELFTYDNGSGNVFYPSLNNIRIKDPGSLIHEIGHWGFFQILSAEDRIAFMEYMGKVAYDKDGKYSPKHQKEVLVYGTRINYVDEQGRGAWRNTNAMDDFQEYFAENFRQYYMNRELSDPKMKSIFDHIVGLVDKIVERFRKKGYNPEMVKYFDKIIISKGKNLDKKISEKITVYRGEGKNFADGVNEGFEWVSVNESTAKDYSKLNKDGTWNVKKNRIDRPKKVFRFPWRDNTSITTENLVDVLSREIAKQSKAKTITLETWRNKIRPLRDKLLKAGGSKVEPWHSKVNKPETSKLVADILYELGYDAIEVQWKNKNKETELTYGIVKKSQKIKREDTVAFKAATAMAKLEQEFDTFLQESNMSIIVPPVVVKGAMKIITKGLEAGATIEAVVRNAIKYVKDHPKFKTLSINDATAVVDAIEQLGDSLQAKIDKIDANIKEIEKEDRISKKPDNATKRSWKDFFRIDREKLLTRFKESVGIDNQSVIDDMLKIDTSQMNDGEKIAYSNMLDEYINNGIPVGAEQFYGILGHQNGEVYADKVRKDIKGNRGDKGNEIGFFNNSAKFLIRHLFGNIIHNTRFFLFKFGDANIKTFMNDSGLTGLLLGMARHHANKERTNKMREEILELLDEISGQRPSVLANLTNQKKIKEYYKKKARVSTMVDMLGRVLSKGNTTKSNLAWLNTLRRNMYQSASVNEYRASIEGADAYKQQDYAEAAKTQREFADWISDYFTVHEKEYDSDGKEIATNDIVQNDQTHISDEVINEPFGPDNELYQAMVAKFPKEMTLLDKTIEFNKMQSNFVLNYVHRRDGEETKDDEYYTHSAIRKISKDQLTELGENDIYGAITGTSLNNGKRVKSPKAGSLMRRQYDNWGGSHTQGLRNGTAKVEDILKTAEMNYYPSYDFMSNQFAAFDKASKESHLNRHALQLDAFLSNPNFAKLIGSTKDIEGFKSELEKSVNHRTAMDDFMSRQPDKGPGRYMFNKVKDFTLHSMYRLLMGPISQRLKQLSVIAYPLVTTLDSGAFFKVTKMMVKGGPQAEAAMDLLMNNSTTAVRNALNVMDTGHVSEDAFSKKLDALGKMSISDPDFQAAVMSWLAAYQHQRIKDGEKNFDWETELQNPNKNAISHATTEVNLSQGSDMRETTADFIKSKSTGLQAVRALIFPFASFTMQLSSSMWIEGANVISGRDRAASLKRLAGFGAVFTGYHATAAVIAATMGKLIHEAISAISEIGDDDDEEAKLMNDIIDTYYGVDSFSFMERIRTGLMRDFFFGMFPPSEPLKDTMFSAYNKVRYEVNDMVNPGQFGSMDQWSRHSDQALPIFNKTKTGNNDLLSSITSRDYLFPEIGFIVEIWDSANAIKDNKTEYVTKDGEIKTRRLDGTDRAFHKRNIFVNLFGIAALDQVARSESKKWSSSYSKGANQKYLLSRAEKGEYTEEEFELVKRKYDIAKKDQIYAFSKSEAIAIKRLSVINKDATLNTRMYNALKLKMKGLPSMQNKDMNTVDLKDRYEERKKLLEELIRKEEQAANK